MTDYILCMASGSGKRFGGNKLLEPFRGEPLYCRCLELLAQLQKRRKNCCPLVISRYEEIRKTAEALGLRTVDCPQSILGQSHTIRAGILALGPLEPGDTLTFLVADQPLLSTGSVEKLLDAPACGIARLVSGGRPGNPVRFCSDLAPELLALTGDQGGGVVIKKHPPTPVEIADPRELADIDTVSDLSRYENSLP